MTQEKLPARSQSQPGPTYENPNEDQHVDPAPPQDGGTGDDPDTTEVDPGGSSPAP